MPPLSVVEPSAAMQTRVEELAEVVGRAGAKVAEVMPAIDQDAYLHDYFALLTLMTSQGLSAEQRASYAADLRAAGDPLSSATADGMTLDAYELQLLLRRRAEAQAAWRELFAHWDVLVCPTALDAAFEHQSGPQHQRSIDVDGRSVRYTLNIVYPMWAIFTGQPATAFPAGLDERGLPVGLQAIGPYLEDRTTLRFAQLLEREWHGFERPPGY
jgi:amidase